MNRPSPFELNRPAVLPAPDEPDIWPRLRMAAQHELTITDVLKLDRLIVKASSARSNGLDGAPRLKIAILSSGTTEHLAPGLRVAGARHNWLLDLYLHDYGAAVQELNDPDSGLAMFHPDVILISYPSAQLFSAAELAQTNEAAAQQLMFASSLLQNLRQLAHAKFSCLVIQQTLLPTALPLVGSHEYRLPGSPAQLVASLNHRLRERSGPEQFALLAMDYAVLRDGLAAWHDRALWNRAKQEISPAAGLAYGELLMQVIDAQRGRAAKCLVLDLDNTIWGGVIGDDGLDGIKLGQGSGIGEAYVAFQSYVKLLAQRGIILAVCSKNDEENALLPFLKHPEMVLRREDISCFVANWNDKASNLSEIARQLNIGLDALVFCDDNPFEREQVRTALPEVRVPELPEDPSYYAEVLASAGYFEAISVTADDFSRVQQYNLNADRERLKSTSGNIDDYLRSLNMELKWAVRDQVNIERITQLINKTNQFTLTTTRYSLSQVQSMMQDPETAVLSFRLLDRLGDNGIICVIIGRKIGPELLIDSWLMSCRVLGRGVEQATLSVLADQAAQLGVTKLRGRYVPSQKNKMVADHYAKLGFSRVGEEPMGVTLWSLALAAHAVPDLMMKITKVEP